MALASQASVFDHQQIERYRNWYERVTYTALDAAVAPLTTALFANTDIATDTGGLKSARLSNVAATSAAGLTLTVQQNNRNTTLVTQAFPPGMIPIFTEPHEALQESGRFNLYWANNTGSALSGTQQVNYAGAMKTLTTWEKVAAKATSGPGWTTLDGLLRAKYAQQSVRPMTLEEALRDGWMSHVVDERQVAVTLNLTTTASTIGPFIPPAGSAYLLHTIAASIPSGSIGNLMSLSITRDNQNPLWTLLLDNAGSNGLPPMRPWVLAANQLIFSAQAVTATTGVTLRFGFYEVALTGAAKALMGLEERSALSGTNLSLYDRIMAGVVPV